MRAASSLRQSLLSLTPRAADAAQEYSNGQLKNKYGDAFIRGNNGARLVARSLHLPCIPCFLHAQARTRRSDVHQHRQDSRLKRRCDLEQ